MSERGTTNGQPLNTGDIVRRPRGTRLYQVWKVNRLDDGRPGVLLFPLAGRSRAVAITDTQARRLVKL